MTLASAVCPPLQFSKQIPRTKDGMKRERHGLLLSTILDPLSGNRALGFTNPTTFLQDKSIN